MQSLTPSLPQPVNISGLKDARTHMQTVYIFRSYNTSTFNAMRLDKNTLKCQYIKEDKKAERFQISHFYWSFSNDSMAVKGLNLWQEAGFRAQCETFCTECVRRNTRNSQLAENLTKSWELITGSTAKCMYR